MDHAECHIRGFMVDITFLWTFSRVAPAFDGKKGEKKKEKYEMEKKGQPSKGSPGTEVALDSLKAVSPSAVPPGAGLPWQGWGRAVCVWISLELGICE